MRLSLRQTQRVVMTPLLQQAIQLLQLSTLELEQVVRKELEENPLLEEVAQETQDVDAEAPASPDATVTETPAPPATTEPVSKETASVDGERADELPFDLTSAVFDEPDERTPVRWPSAWLSSATWMTTSTSGPRSRRARWGLVPPPTRWRRSSVWCRPSTPRGWPPAACRSASSSSSPQMPSPIPSPWRSWRSTSRTWSAVATRTSPGP